MDNIYRFNRAILLVVSLITAAITAWSTTPVVSNVRALQRTDGSFLLDIYYDVEVSDRDRVIVSVMISDDDGSSYSIAPVTLEGDFGEVRPAPVNISSGTPEKIYRTYTASNIKRL